MTDKKQYVTEEGLQKLKNELHELKTVKRKEIAERIADAKELGDLSENAEYHDAKEEQGFVETRIVELEQQLKQVEVIAHKKNTTTVEVGSKITITSAAGEMTFTIVGSSEANPSEQLISNESPLGSAFLGHSKGETVTVQTPGGSVDYTISSVE